MNEVELSISILKTEAEVWKLEMWPVFTDVKVIMKEKFSSWSFDNEFHLSGGRNG